MTAVAAGRNDEWVIAARGESGRKRHRMRPNGSVVCGMVDQADDLIPASEDSPPCAQCEKFPLDLTESLSRYTVSDSGCWLWQGYIDKNGYGRVGLSGGRGVDWVHRVSYRHHVGPIPARHEIDHKCQVTRCMNPSHLEAVTRSEHAARTWRRMGSDDRHLFAAHLRHVGMSYADIADALGLSDRSSAARAVRAAIGKGLIDPEQVPPAKRLTEADRQDIRDMFAFGITQRDISRFYEIDNSQISRICNGMNNGHKRMPA